MTQFKKIIPILVLALTTSIFTSCGKRAEIIEIISESEAVEIIESTLQNNVGGLTTNLEDIAEQLVTAITSGQLCDTVYTDFVEKDHQGAQGQAAYRSDFSYEMTCNNFNVPQTATFSILTASDYSSLKIESDDNSDFNGNASRLQPSNSTLTIGGIYSKEGTQTLSFRDKKSINSTFAIDLTDLEIDKQSYEIQSGTGNFAFSGSNEDESFLYEGSIIFNGNHTANLTLNGTSYDLDWE